MSKLLFEDIADKLRQQIIAKKLAPGQQMPTEAALQADHAVSRNTVRRALNVLEKQGYITSQGTQGRYVRDINPLIWWADKSENVDPDAWTQCVRAQNREPTERISVAIDEAPEHIAALLHIGAGDPVVVRKRLRYADGELYTAADSYYPHAIAAGTRIAEPGEIWPGVWKIMADAGYGWDDANIRDEIRAHPAVAEEAAVFNVQLGYPIIELTRTRYTVEGTPVAVALTTAPYDRLTIVYEPKPREAQ